MELCYETKEPCSPCGAVGGARRSTQARTVRHRRQRGKVVSNCNLRPFLAIVSSDTEVPRREGEPVSRYHEVPSSHACVCPQFALFVLLSVWMSSNATQPQTAPYQAPRCPEVQGEILSSSTNIFISFFKCHFCLFNPMLQQGGCSWTYCANKRRGVLEVLSFYCVNRGALALRLMEASVTSQCESWPPRLRRIAPASLIDQHE
uniref:Uncharacterized protein n=1 Tax=Myotis myotis TaxID=51298 RepID=A0A7J7QTI0_MYOMY|nr:hypothetical protein mMyoMyo1_011826 [Myotis myotis]